MASGVMQMVFLWRQRRMSFKSVRTQDLSTAVSAVSALSEPLESTLLRWRTEAAELDRLGIYDWLANRVSADRVLEVGCGFGMSTAALVRAGKTVFALDSRMDCLKATRSLVPEATYGVADVHHYDDHLIADLQAFAPEAVVCWLAGAPAEALPRDVPAAYAVMQYRLQLQHSVVRMAMKVDTVRTIHLADRTAFPWKMKDTGRQTLVGMISSVILSETPFGLDVSDVQFKKIELPVASRQLTGSLAGLIPVIGEATIKRRHNVS